MNPGRGMIVFRITMMRVGNSAMMMAFLDRPMAMPKTIRPSRNWPAKQEKKTKQRDEEALHTVRFRCVSLTDDETRFKSFENPSVLLTRFLRDYGRKILARALRHRKCLGARSHDAATGKSFF
jgi:hypothetical protein